MSGFTERMESLSDYMTEKVTPWTNRVTGNPWIKSLQDSVLAIVPLVLVGSLITLVSILNEFFTWMPNLTPINQFTFGLMGLIVSFMIPYQVMLHKHLRDRQIVAGVTGLAVFLMLIGPTFSDDGATVSFQFERFGAAGMFTAIGGGLIVGAIFNVFGKLKLFKGSNTLPDFLVVWFDSLIPILICIATSWILTDVAHFDVFAGIQ